MLFFWKSSKSSLNAYTILYVPNYYSRQVLCNKCCSMKYRLEYQGNIDSRVCGPCYQLLIKGMEPYLHLSINLIVLILQFSFLIFYSAEQEHGSGDGDWSSSYANNSSNNVNSPQVCMKHLRRGVRKVYSNDGIDKKNLTHTRIYDCELSVCGRSFYSIDGVICVTQITFDSLSLICVLAHCYSLCSRDFSSSAYNL